MRWRIVRISHLEDFKDCAGERTQNYLHTGIHTLLDNTYSKFSKFHKTNKKDMVHNSSACCGLVSIEEFHPTLLTLPLPVYLPLLYSAL